MRNITNLSIKQSAFLEECEIAKLKHIFKKGASTDPRNCQPISLVSLVSKIIEKVILFQIKTLKKKIIYMYQSGFRTNHSTNFCPAHLIDFALTGMDKRMDTNMMLVNLQKVLDT